MLTLVKTPQPAAAAEESAVDRKELEALVCALGKRLQSEYIAGAIPYLRQQEPELWAELEVLDGENSLAALLAYERLFFEGLRRYVAHLDARRMAA
jgi:hypothetical protein